MLNGRDPDDGARVLVYDIETAPSRGWVWKKYQTDVIKFDADWYILCFAWKWLGTKQTHVVSLPDFDLYETEPENDRGVVADLHELFCQADVTVTHNGVGFDNKKANSRFAVHQMDPPPPRKEIDTLQVARRQFGFTSNSLADLCDTLGLPAKGDPGGKETWFRCMAGDPAAWAKMTKYNKRDVDILEKLYLRLRPWMANHPNLNVYGDRPDSCPRCGHKQMQARGYRVAGVTMRRTFQCQRCFGYSMGREIHDTRIKHRAI